MKLRENTWVDAPAEIAWELVADPSHYLHFMEGITRWQVVGERETGLGARYRVLMHVGSAEIGGLVEIVESVPARELAWVSLVGIEQRGRWRLRPDPLDPMRTNVELRLGFNVPGGIVGRFAERVARRTVQRHMRRSLRELRRQIEHEQARLVSMAP